MSGIREFFDTPAGKWTAIGFVSVMVLLAAWSARGTFGESDAVAMTRNTVFYDIEADRPFDHTIEPGETMPVVSPHSGKATGYIPERCYWTADGKVKEEPTYVVLNAAVPGRSGPTYCPDCDRLVVQDNLYPNPGAVPPPKKGEPAAKQ